MWYEYTFWIGSMRNISFNYEETVDLRDYGYEDEEEWANESQKETFLNEIAEEIAFDKYVEFGVSKKDDND